MPDQELQAQVALQLVALDLSETEQRERGAAALPRVLWREGAPVQTFPRLRLDRAGYLRQLLQHTTAAEQALRSCSPAAFLPALHSQSRAAPAC